MFRWSNDSCYRLRQHRINFLTIMLQILKLYNILMSLPVYQLKKNKPKKTQIIKE